MRQSLFALGSLAVIWALAVVIGKIVPLAAGGYVAIGGLLSALVIEAVVFHRRRPEPRGFPIEPIERKPDSASE